MGVSFDEINQTISVAAGSNYVNDYTNNGRVQQVIVQADAPYRMQPEQLLALSVKNRLGQMLPLSTFVTPECCTAATDTLSGISCHTHNRQCRTGKIVRYRNGGNGQSG